MAVLSKPDKVAQTKSFGVLATVNITGFAVSVTYNGDKHPIDLANQLFLFLLCPAPVSFLGILSNDLGSDVDVFGISRLNGFDGRTRGRCIGG